MHTSPAPFWRELMEADLNKSVICGQTNDKWHHRRDLPALKEIGLCSDCPGTNSEHRVRGHTHFFACSIFIDDTLQGCNESGGCQLHKVSFPHSVRLIAYCPLPSSGSGGQWKRLLNPEKGWITPVFICILRGRLCSKKIITPPFLYPSFLPFSKSWGPNLRENLLPLCMPPKCIWVDPPVCGWVIEFHTWGHRFLGGAWE